MLTRLEKARQTWGGKHALVDQWLDERKNVLVGYCHMAGLPPYESKKGELPSPDELKDFCGLLMDYVSSGHFEVYDKLLEECNLQGKAQWTQAIHAKIGESTDLALAFNDRYTEQLHDEALLKLDKDLSLLGEALSQRFEAEDQMIAAISTSQQSLSA